MKRPNYTMLCDYYELTMANGYFENGMSDRISYFDMFFRNIPDGGGFAIAAGLEQLCEYIENPRRANFSARAKNTGFRSTLAEGAFLAAARSGKWSGNR